MTPLLTLRAVSHRFGATLALRRIDLEILPGERLGIAGPSGSGKSTLARLLTFHLKPQEGERQVAAGSSTVGSPRRRFQLVFQDPGRSFVHHWKVWEVAAETAAIDGMDASGRQDLAKMLFERVRLSPSLADRHPLELSGGERRRLAIARALGAKPDMLVLDESLSGLDGPLQRDLTDMLRAVCTVTPLALVTVSHDLRLLSHVADRIVVLDEGALVEDTPVAGFLEAPSSAMGRRLLAATFGGAIRP